MCSTESARSGFEALNTMIHRYMEYFGSSTHRWSNKAQVGNLYGSFSYNFRYVPGYYVFTNSNWRVVVLYSHYCIFLHRNRPLNNIIKSTVIPDCGLRGKRPFQIQRPQKQTWRLSWQWHKWKNLFNHFKICPFKLTCCMELSHRPPFMTTSNSRQIKLRVYYCEFTSQ